MSNYINMLMMHCVIIIYILYEEYGNMHYLLYIRCLVYIAVRNFSQVVESLLSVRMKRSSWLNRQIFIFMRTYKINNVRNSIQQIIVWFSFVQKKVGKNIKYKTHIILL